MKLEFTRLTPDATFTPSYGTEGAACFDIAATSVEQDGITSTYKTGLAFQIPPGHVGLLFPRSSVAKTDQILANSVGVIDSDYRGEVMFKFKRLGIRCYSPGDRVGQMMIVPIPRVELVEVESLSETDRGDGGFGSTGS